MRLDRNRCTALNISLLLVVIGGAACTKESPQGPPVVGDCEALARLDLHGLPDAPTTIESATLVAATQDLPAFCRVTGFVAPQVRFEARLPSPDTWSSKFYMAGCGGFCGAVDAEGHGSFANSANYGLRRNYAVVTTDTGHTGESPTDARWAYNNRELEIDFGYRAVHVVTLATKKVIAAYYGQPAARSYFAGCSNGGRQGLMEAQRYPDDFDGVIAGAPTMDFPGIVTAVTWMAQANLDSLRQPILTASKPPLLHDAALAGCDGLDGLVDGLIDDPRACTVDPSALLCVADDQPTCLTSAQVAAAEKLYGGPKDSSGTPLYPGGSPPGSELDWSLMVIGSSDFPPAALQMSESFLRYLGFEEDPDPTYDPLTFDFDMDVADLWPMASIFSATDPDLRAFQARGGKLILYHGWADAGTAPLRTVQYYEAVAAEMGGMATTQEFARLFMIPGAHHCGGGPLGDESDFLTALEDWVERGVAPDRVIASRSEGGVVTRTRPVFPYPLVARYSGSGSIDDAESFIPVQP